jgi:hypothetical protein
MQPEAELGTEGEELPSFAEKQETVAEGRKPKSRRFL